MFKLQVWMDGGVDVVHSDANIDALYDRLDQLMSSEDVSKWELTENGQLVMRATLDQHGNEDCSDEDEGQPTEYEEWQDYMGGDDWDHGQYDNGGEW